MFTNIKRFYIVLGSIAAAIILLVVLLYHFLFAAPGKSPSSETFSIAPTTQASAIPQKLKDAGYIRSKLGFRFIMMFNGGVSHIVPGGYTIPAGTNARGVAHVLLGKPALVWLTIVPGTRKEEIGENLVKILGWTPAQLADWNTKATTDNPSYSEGVYFPDTYLIPLGSTPTDVATRVQKHFEEVFAPYLAESLKLNIRWPTALRIASLVQREAKDSTDMPLVSGIIWNRLLKNMKLQIDATVQYARGNTGAGWWAPVTHDDLSLKSPYNTYLNAGLPPHPIDEPSLAAIKATLESEPTDCLYYLHDKTGMIHCSATYEGQQANIEQYLK